MVTMRPAVEGPLPASLPYQILKKPPAIELPPDLAQLLKTNHARIEAMEKLRTDPAFIAKDRAVEAHTVFRSANGKIAAIQWQDGQTEIFDRKGYGWDKSAVETKARADGLDDRGVLDAFARDLERVLGPGMTVERYSGDANAPTRGDFRDGLMFREADLLAGRRVDVSA